jgi:hypothetical protein
MQWQQPLPLKPQVLVVAYGPNGACSGTCERFFSLDAPEVAPLADREWSPIDESRKFLNSVMRLLYLTLEEALQHLLNVPQTVIRIDKVHCRGGLDNWLDQQRWRNLF